MKLTDFDKTNYASRALEENYKLNFDVSKLSKFDTQNMLRKIRTLANEAKNAPDFRKNQVSPSYMKLVFMEQALVEHYNVLLSKPAARIVVENEEVEKSQVVLAAQDMVDTIQKMLEDIGQMQVKELPALVDSIESEIGANEAQTYNDQVSSQLDTLSGALKAAFAALKSARDSITGGGADSFTEPAVDAAMGDDMAGADDEMAGMDAGAGAAMGADDAAMPALETPPEETEEPTDGIGRAKR